MRLDTRVLKLLFPSVLFTTNDREIHLTFDDGPHPLATPVVLRILKSHDIQATFFLLGEHVQNNPDLARQIKSEGHQIGNHSYSHTRLAFKKRAFVQNEILQTKEILESTIGEHSKLFRPPYGYFDLTTLSIAEEFGFTSVLWSVNSKDFKAGAESETKRRVLQKTTNGSIILFHDNKYTARTIETYLPFLLDILMGKGFVFNILHR